ncbi:MAG: PAS domain-containing sensor histidine kinase [Deltaproteobacteria bacterium GWC2_42_11]|nr:MAG: PAS domain-containing sensor histidine kinase [Deltaproteobacteria bacterium GWC2_42_11]HBO84818.1 PAS domain-containing sensor histidine kinase [Deltaproteobacteria bacterium]
MDNKSIDVIKEAADIRRQKRERYIIFAIAILIVVLTYAEIHISNINTRLPFATNILVFSLINIQIILLILLVFLAMRNFVKLAFERRSRVMGSKLRTKLVAAFVLLSIVPTLLLFFTVIGFINKSIESWFGIKLEDSLQSSIEVAQGYYNNTSEKASYFARQIGLKVAQYDNLTDEDMETLRNYIDEKRDENNISAVEVFSSSGERLIYSISSSINPNMLSGVNENALIDALKGNQTSHAQTLDKGDVISAVVPIYHGNTVTGAVTVSFHMPNPVIERIKDISSTFEAYKQLKVLKTPVKAIYFTTLLIVTLVIVVLATWIGYYLAKQITIPIQKLADATNAVAGGNLDYKINMESRDEIGSLVKSFNKMTEDLRLNKSMIEETNIDLKRTNLELEQRRNYMEIVLANIAAGVISIDKGGRITTINKAARELLSINTDNVMGKNYKEVLKPRDEEILRDMIKEMNELGVEIIERQAKIKLKDNTVTLLVNLTMLKDEDGRYLGMVAVLDDLSHLLKTQRMMAWKEVAQRIAHEIKNPLTPIQLSAQRLRKKYIGRFADDGHTFEECTKTIIHQVEELKTLVNEFSSFARMPAANPTPNNINEIVNEAVALYRAGNKHIEFKEALDSSIPIMEVDRDQMKRALINILDNSVAAIEKEGVISVLTSHDKTFRLARIEVIDTGCGIPPEDKAKLFEPYFSRKKSGTGLGLAIVNNIIADHNGFIRVKDNIPRGTRFIIELPVKGAIAA